MNVKMLLRNLVALVTVAIIYSAGVWGQEPEPSERPKPAGQSIPSVIDPLAQGDTTTQDSGNDWKPDAGPLTGLQTATLGNPELRHSYWVPGIEYGGTVQNQPTGGPQSSNWFSTNYFGVNLSLVQEWTRSQLTLNYTGGGFVTTQPGTDNGWFQQFGFGQTFTWSRWQVQILDQFSYLPASQFGFGGGTGLGIPGIGGSLGQGVPGIGGGVALNQSIYTAIGPSLNNTFVAEATYQLSRRTSLTIGGSDGVLHFTQSGNVDTYNYLGNLGYNYMLTKEDTLGLVYRFTALHFQGEPQAIGDHVINVAYGRKITKRLALQLNVGPEITYYRVPVGTAKRTIAGNGGATFSYALRNASISLSYFHGVTGGSGVLIGANTDQITLSAGKQITRLWSLNGNFGFSQNRPLASQVGIQGANYNAFYVSGGVGRPMGRNANFSIAYTAQIQLINPTICTGTGCNTSFTQHMVTVSLQWHTRPFVLR